MVPGGRNATSPNQSFVTTGHTAPISELRAFNEIIEKSLAPIVSAGMLFMLPLEQWHLPNKHLKTKCEQMCLNKKVDNG